MGGGGSSPHPPAPIRHTIRKKNEGKQYRPPVSQPTNRPSRIRTSARQPPDEKGRPENKPIRLPSGHHPLSARHPRHRYPCRSVRPAAIPAAKQSPATGATGQPLGSWQKPARKVPYPAASPAMLIPGEELTCRCCSATGAAGHDSAGANRRRFGGCKAFCRVWLDL